MKVLLVGLSLVILAAAGWLKFSEPKAQPAAAVPLDTASASANNPDLSDTDDQGTGKVVAEYRPSESSTTQATVKVTLTSTAAEIAAYDYMKNLVWADADVNPMPTISGELLVRQGDTMTVKMVFPRDSRVHYHFIVKNLGGIHDRVLHFYTIKI